MPDPQDETEDRIDLELWSREYRFTMILGDEDYE